MKQEYVPPVFKQKAFNCPICNAYAKQYWDDLGRAERGTWQYDLLSGCICSCCGKESIWYDGIMIFPDFGGVQPSNLDLSEDIQKDYQEAASILHKSPRGAAAILRLSIQKLCKDLGEEGKNINIDIKNLVSKGLSQTVQKSLDIVRVVGNDAVHPGQIDLRDDVDIAKVLFKLINIIAEKMISEPREVEEIYNSLPENKKEQITQRDKDLSGQ